VSDLFDHAFKIVSEIDMAAVTIQNQVNENDKPTRNSFLGKNQLSVDVIRNVFEKVS